MTRAVPLPGAAAIDELGTAIGGEAAGALARAFGGVSLYVPKSIGDHHPICAAIGRDAADRLADWGGGSTIGVPKQIERRARVQSLRQRGALTVTQIAVETSFSERHVYRLLREERDDRQPSLFDDR